MPPRLRLQSLGALRLIGPDGELLPRRRKELALLVLLVSRAPKPVRREELTALFWGEREEEKARSSLRHAVLRLRRACDDLLDITRDIIGVRDAAAFDFDVHRFETAAADARFTDAIDVYTGDFLPGFEDVGEEEFRLWQDRERERLRRLLDFCYAGAVSQCEAAHDGAAMVHWSAAWLAAFPHDARACLRGIEALCLSGRPGEAASVRTSFVADPDSYATTEWLAETARMITDAVTASERRAGPLTPFAARQLPSAVHVVADHPRVVGKLERPAGMRRRVLAFAAITSVIVVLAAWRFGLIARLTEPTTVLAIGHIDVVGVPDSAAALPQLLAIGLDEVTGLRVIGETRMQDVLSLLRAKADKAVDLRRAAEKAGASQIIEGVLVRSRDAWRLDLQRVDLDRDVAITSYRLSGDDLFELIDDAVRRVGRDFGASAQPGRLAGTTTSLAAYRLYQVGLRAHYDGDENASRRLFAAALAIDSTFAMAAYYASLHALIPDAIALLQQAVRMSERASDRDRLFIRSAWLRYQNEPAMHAVSETVAVRYTSEPQSHQERAGALVFEGRFLEAAAHYQRVVALDSIGLAGVAARCLGCDAFRGAVTAYYRADSLAAAERLAREWQRRQPQSMNATLTLFGILAAQERFPEAIAAFEEAQRYDNEHRLTATGATDLWLRMGDFTRVDSFWRGALESADRSRKAGLLETAILSMRMQGRKREALALSTQLRATASADSNGSLRESYMQATVLYEAGRYRESAILFDSAAALAFSDSPARNGRHRAWNLALAAAGYAGDGDTARVRMLTDTVRIEGARSGYRRDQLLHYYVRGLHLRMLGRDAESAVAFRQSLYSPVEGNARATLELARTLVDLGRAREAVPLLRAAMIGPVGASGQYVNRTELYYEMGRAYEVAGMKVEASAAYRRVLRSWEHADPSLQPRRADIERRLQTLNAEKEGA